MAKKNQGHKASRREFVKKAAYVAPLILSLKAAPSYAKAGSVKPNPNPPPKPKPPKPPKPRGS